MRVWTDDSKISMENELVDNGWFCWVSEKPWKDFKLFLFIDGKCNLSRGFDDENIRFWNLNELKVTSYYVMDMVLMWK